MSCHTQEPLKRLARYSASVYTQDRHAGTASSLHPKIRDPSTLQHLKNTMRLDIHPVFTEQLLDSSHDFSSSVNLFPRNVPSCFQETTTAMNQKTSPCSTMQLEQLQKMDEFPRSNNTKTHSWLLAICPWLYQTLNNQTSRMLLNSNFRMKLMSKKNRNQKKTQKLHELNSGLAFLTFMPHKNQDLSYLRFG